MPLVENKNRDEILSAVRDYAYRLRAAGENAVGFLYYSGHGFAVGEHNYLLPVDLISTSAKTVEVKGLRLQELIDILEEKTPKAAHFVIFDACRSELQGARGEKGFRPVSSRQGMVIAFSTAPGSTASDGERSDPSGPYAAALAEELKRDGQHHLDLFQNVRERVHEDYPTQVPWDRNGLLKRIYFAGGIYMPEFETPWLFRVFVQMRSERVCVPDIPLSPFEHMVPVQEERDPGFLEVLEELNRRAAVEKAILLGNTLRNVVYFERA